MKLSMRFFAATAAVVACSALVISSSAAATAAPDNLLVVCPGNSLSSLDETGAPLSALDLKLAFAQVQHLCEAGVGSTMSFDEYDSSLASPDSLTSEYANVVAQINNRPGLMGISAYANSIPLDGRTKELSCIYRMQPVSGPATPWESCGAETTSSSTYLTTRGNDFCPVLGTRWEAVADLYVNGNLTQSDSAIAVAL